MKNTPPPSVETKSIENPGLPVWNCKLDSAPQAGEFTVGEVSTISCSGDRPVDFGKGKLAIHFPDEYMFSMHMYDLVDVTSNSISFKAVSYRVGKWDLSQMEILEDGSAKVKLGGLIYPVKSVQDPQNPRKEPFGPADPFKLAWPSYVYVMLFVFVTVIIGSVVLLITRNVRKKMWERNVAKHDTALQPYHQFQKDLRILRRDFDFTQKKQWGIEDIKKYLEALDQMFKLFILREFRVPALDWNRRAQFREMKKNKKRKFFVYEKKLVQVYNELARASKSPDSVKAEDCHKLMMLCRDVSTTIWKTHLSSISKLSSGNLSSGGAQ